MKKVKVFSKLDLIKANAAATRDNAGRVLRNISRLPEGLVFPVTRTMLHNDKDIRCWIQINDAGTVVELDVPIAQFNRLRVLEVDV